MMLTVKEVATTLNISEMTVYRWISQKKLKAYKIARNLVRINKADLEEFLEKKKTKNENNK